MDFDGDNSYDEGMSAGIKPPPHQSLDYKRWRTDIIPAINTQFLMTEEIVDDDLHEFEDTDIYEKHALDIKAIRIYLHNLENWYGTGDQDTDKFQIQV